MIRADATSCPGLFRRSKSPESECQFESSELDIKKKPLNHSIEGSKAKTKKKKRRGIFRKQPLVNDRSRLSY